MTIAAAPQSSIWWTLPMSLCKGEEETTTGFLSLMPRYVVVKLIITFPPWPAALLQRACRRSGRGPPPGVHKVSSGFRHLPVPGEEFLCGFRITILENGKSRLIVHVLLQWKIGRA